MFCAQNIDPVHAQSGLSDGLVACWNMDEPGGPRADLVNFHHLTDVNTVGYAGGVLDNAAYIIGANSEVLNRSISSDPAMTPSTWTISSWFYIESGTTAYQWYYATGGTQAYAVWGAAYSNKVRLYINGLWAIDSAETLSTGTWYLVTSWHDETANQMGIQINDNTPVTYTYASGTMPAATTFGWGLAGLTTARIDNGALWNEVQTSTERAEFYNGGAGVSCDEILATSGQGGVIDDGSQIYTVDLPVGDEGTLKAQITFGDMLVSTLLVGTLVVSGYDLLRHMVYGARYKDGND